MKRILLSLLFLAMAAVGLMAQLPKVAVLDATIPKGFDGSVIVPITENIIEEIVKSKKYTVLDRNNIAAIFKERDFQLSGEVTDSDITKAGKMLGADFVVVSKMQQVGDTYFLTAKMINVTSSVIAGQASYSKDGKLTVLLDMAHVVGWSLATGEKVPASGAVANTPAPTTGSKTSSASTTGPAAPLALGASSGSYASITDKKATLYVLVGIHPNSKSRDPSAANFLQDGYLPAGTEIQFIDDNAKAYKFKAKASGVVYTYEYHKQAAEDFKVHLTRIFGAAWDPAIVTRLSAVDQQGIASGKVAVGMSRQGVVLAMGLPPKAENPDLNAKQWKYWKSRTNTELFIFDDQGLLTQIKD